MPIGIVRTTWSGTSGGPGLTQIAIAEGAGAFWTATQAQNAVNAVRNFWVAVQGLLPDDVVLTVQPVVDIYNEADGQLTASVSAPTPPTSLNGTSTAVFGMALGVKMSLNTGVIRNGRRVRGGIFIVPTSSAVYGSNGLVLSASRTTVNNAGTALMTALSAAGLVLSVYSRPLAGDTPRPGAHTPVNGVETGEKGALLRGRRD
jgi:hypothetical protein